MLHGNTSDKDIIIYFTTTGWMMYNWMVSALATGAAIVVYDGAPLLIRLWDIVDELGITIFGTSAKWIATNEQQGLIPKDTHKLERLHTVLSTGSPLSAQSYRYVYKAIKSNIMLGSITGMLVVRWKFSDNARMPYLMSALLQKVALILCRFSVLRIQIYPFMRVRFNAEA